MSAVMPFTFEKHNIRILLDDLGVSWFVANDVCGALEYSNPSKAIADHVDNDDLTKREVVDARGRKQLTNMINESGLYALIFGSHKPQAQRFKRWVTSDVLPTIRKTGQYNTAHTSQLLPAPTHDRVQALLLIADAMTKVPGVKPAIAMAATLTCIHESTGLQTEALRRALPANEEPICSLNATQLGKLLGLSARTTNLTLQRHGLQDRNDRDEWELTQAGEAWAQAMPFSRNGHSGYQILWNPAVADVVREVA